MPFPGYLYHPDGRAFICPSKDFFDSLPDKDKWENLPFTGPRRVVPTKCIECKKLKEDIVKLELALVEKDLLIEELKSKRGPGRPKKEPE